MIAWVKISTPLKVMTLKTTYKYTGHVLFGNKAPEMIQCRLHDLKFGEIFLMLNEDGTAYTTEDNPYQFWMYVGGETYVSEDGRQYAQGIPLFRIFDRCRIDTLEEFNQRTNFIPILEFMENHGYEPSKNILKFLLYVDLKKTESL